MRAAALALSAVLAACGGGDRGGVPVTEADPGPAVAPPRPPPRVAPLDTVYADSGLYADPRLDSLRADSASGPAAALPEAAPDFRAFWPRFQRALRAGPDSAAALARLGEGSAPLDALAGPFLDRALALTARDFRRDGAARDVQIRVGYDAEGAVVPEDEALTESAVRLRFEVVEGAYRLVRLDVAG